jgi:hypothetical protein
MTLIYVNDEKTTITSLCAMIDKAPKMDVFKLEEAELDGTTGDIIVLSKALCEHPCLEEFHTTVVTLTDASLSLDQAIFIILVSVPDLKHVKLEKVHISSSALAAAGNCTSLTTPMRGHPCLEEFRLTGVTLIDALMSLDQVISMVLDSVPDLSYVKLEETPASSSAVAAVGYCTSLKTATPIVPNSSPTEKDAIKLAEAVAQSSSIQLNDIPGDLSDVGCDAFATDLHKMSLKNAAPIVSKSGPTDKDAMKFVEAVAPSPSMQLHDIPADLSDDGWDGCASFASIQLIDIPDDVSDVGCDAFATAVGKIEGDGKMSSEQRALIDTALCEKTGGRANAA